MADFSGYKWTRKSNNFTYRRITMPIWVIQLLIRMTAAILSAIVALIAVYGIGLTAYQIPSLARLELQLWAYLFFVDWAIITLVPIIGYALACSFTRKPRLPALFLFACLHASLIPLCFPFVVDNSDYTTSAALYVLFNFFYLILLPAIVSAIVTEVVTGVMLFLKRTSFP
jgi:hypothetical protein